ncbi:helix-turn-helix domain-containing protein [Streptomyces albidoflavus]
MLGEELRRLRVQRGCTLAQAAAAIRGSTSKMSRLELGRNPVKARDIEDLVRFYNLSIQEVAVINQLMTQATNAEWYERYSDVTPHYLRRLIEIEGRASEIRIFENQAVPGLLQTEDYARELVKLMTGLTGDAREKIVALRLARQRILEQAELHLTVILDESILMRRRGSARVMQGQMEHLLHIAQNPLHGLRIVSLDTISPPYAITYLRFDSGTPPVAYVENVDSATYATQTRVVEGYHAAMNGAFQAALPREGSLARLEEAVEDWGRKAAREER